MIAMTNLSHLMARMEAELDPEQFVYCTIPHGRAHLNLDPLCSFREFEGETLILRRTEAEQNRLDFTFVCRKITLRVHSSLEAVGFLAVVATELAQHGISANCVSAFYHDHLFVPAGQEQRALAVLRELQNRWQTTGTDSAQ